jgi:hypothetical protein
MYNIKNVFLYKRKLQRKKGGFYFFQSIDNKWKKFITTVQYMSCWVYSYIQKFIHLEKVKSISLIERAWHPPPPQKLLHYPDSEQYNQWLLWT